MSRWSSNQDKGTVMAKRKKGSKVQKRGKLPKGKSATRGKARKAVRAKAKPKRAPVKKAARKVKQPLALVVETIAVDVIEQPAPGVITVTEVEENMSSELNRTANRAKERGSRVPSRAFEI
jgi:hypothetical protein